MPRKAATEVAEPRRSVRIKEQPKEPAGPTPAPKKRTKKEKEPADKDGKPKSQGKKRKAAEGPNGEADDASMAAPTEKKVRFYLLVAELAFLRHSMFDLID